MYCVKCGKEVKEGTKFCTNCGAEMEGKDEKLSYSQNNTIETTSNPTPVAVQPTEAGDGKGTASLILGIVSFVVPCVGFITSIVGLILGICAKKSGKKTAGIILNAIALGLIIIAWIFLYSLGYVATWTGLDEPTPTNPTVVTPSKPSVTTSTSTVTFDGFEITIGNNFEIVKDTNTSSKHYGADVIKLPATIKNVSADGDHLNMYHHYYYGPTGTKLDKLLSDFGSRVDAIDYVHVDRGNSKIQYFYILYDGDGKYTIEFNNYSEKKTVEFTIKK